MARAAACSITFSASACAPCARYSCHLFAVCHACRIHVRSAFVSDTLVSQDCSLHVQPVKDVNCESPQYMCIVSMHNGKRARASAFRVSSSGAKSQSPADMQVFQSAMSPMGNVNSSVFVFWVSLVLRVSPVIGPSPGVNTVKSTAVVFVDVDSVRLQHNVDVRFGMRSD